ncbi:sorting nexin-11 [Engraulis encrasicolus]|uniref:sorting nexin-11 n=1 Tax=Engraulis encrasicolus TaxID=184585 RepID=UPI002FD25588
MIKSQDQDEFVAVRVQDPRVQNEGSWNSYVDFKIFLHTNSKAFTAKTSCVRRRYSEFVWLRKKLQKNAGLVPVPDLPSKSFFSFNNEDFIERRRKGLQGFLDKVVHLTVCLSDSQLHLFLQTQLPVSHIQDCVMGLTPYTVMDAILTYASSNQGWAQAQEEESDATQEQCPSVPYESMESPSPHVPSSQHGDQAPVPADSQEDGDATADSVTVDVHQVNLVELTVGETEKETQVDTAADPSIEGQVETLVDLQPQGVDLEIVNQVDAVKEEEKAEVTKRAEENGTAVEQLLAVDKVEELLAEVGLVEQTVTHSDEENTSDVVLEETVEIPESTVVEERNEEEKEKATTVHPMNVELSGEQVESASNHSSENDTLVLELAVGPQSLEEPSLKSGACENKSSQDFRETCTVKGQNEEQSQSEESEMHPAAPVERMIPAALVDENLSVELVEEQEELETEKKAEEEKAETEESEKEEEEKGKEAEMEENNLQTVHLPVQTAVDERTSAEKAEEEEEEEAEREKDEEKENEKEEKDEVEDAAADDEEVTLQTAPLQNQENPDQEEDHHHDDDVDDIKTNGVTNGVFNGCHSSDNSAASSAIEESVEEEVPDSDLIEEVGKAISAMATETTVPGNTVESGNAEEHHADEGEPIAEDCCDLKGQNCQGQVTGQPCSDPSVVLENIQGDPSPGIASQEPDVSL